MYDEKENYQRVVHWDAPDHVCVRTPARGSVYAGAWPAETRPAPDVMKWRDGWGVEWTDLAGEVFPTGPALPSYEDVDRLQVPDPHAPGILERAAQMEAELDRGQFFFSLGHPYFLYEKAINILGPEEFAVSMLAAPDAAHALLDAILDHELGIAEQYVRLRPDHVSLSDDYGHQDRLAMSPALWRTFFKPRMKRIIDFYRDALGPDVLIFHHSCGHVMPILEDYVEIGVDVLHPVQTRANDLAEMRLVTSRRLTLCGGICGQRVLPLGSPDEVRAEVMAKMDLLWEDGGYLPDAEKTLGVPPENLEAMYEAVREWSREHVEAG